MIPLSSRIDKYKKIVDNKKKAGKPCDIIHIVKLDDDRESAFLIQDMFPITEEYIEREYTIEYSCAMKSHFRKSGNQMSGKWKSSCASLLA